MVPAFPAVLRVEGSKGRHQLLSVVLVALLIEPCYILHNSELVEKEPDREDITFKYIVLRKS